jgi:hypothetical protein
MFMQSLTFSLSHTASSKAASKPEGANYLINIDPGERFVSFGVLLLPSTELSYVRKSQKNGRNCVRARRWKCHEQFEI